MDKFHISIQFIGVKVYKLLGAILLTKIDKDIP